MISASFATRMELPETTARPAVLVADDDPAVQSALIALISRRAPGVHVAGCAADADEAVALASRTRPAVALIDVHMPAGGGARATAEILRVSPRTKVLAISASADRSAVVGMLEAGASGYIVKGCSGKEILGAIASALQGRSTLSSDVTGGVIEELREQKDAQRRADEHLSTRKERVRRAARDLTMVGQPIRDLKSLEIVGIEALARFHGVSRRKPYLWFEEARELGLGRELEIAAARLAWKALDVLPPNVFLAVNASPMVIGSSTFQRAIEAHFASRLVLELTEHAPVSDYGRLRLRLQSLRARGVRVAVDDAGAGFASLRHILLLNPEIIKLDISLISRIASDRGAQALAKGLISFADAIGAMIVAEGVETAEQRATLLELGVRHGQGFLLGRPQNCAHPFDLSLE